MLEVEMMVVIVSRSIERAFFVAFCSPIVSPSFTGLACSRNCPESGLDGNRWIVLLKTAVTIAGADQLQNSVRPKPLSLGKAINKMRPSGTGSEKSIVECMN